jgi:molecular chaperone DnaJ
MAQRDWADKDYYKVLGVSKTATKDEIKKAYRKLAQKHHPDANEGDASAEARFKEISEAHAILSNDEKRAEYDQIRQFMEGGGERFYGFQPGGGQGSVRVNIGDLFGDGGVAGANPFEDLFGFGPRRPARGQDLETSVQLTFDEAISGTTRTINGANVRIPPGVKDGQRIKVAGKGGQSGGQPGDLYVVVSVEPHPIFTQGNGGDLHVKLPISFTEAALGSKVAVPTLDGQVTLKIPAGTQTGRTFRVRGKGGPRPRGGNGDLLVTVEVQVPTKLTKPEKESLEAFAALHDASPRPNIDDEIESGSKVKAS